MKKSIITITKTAMKHFFDIDPVITEHMILQTATGAHLLQTEVRNVLQHNMQQSKSKIIQLLHPDMSQNWNAA